jgi:glycosyltransferase involved in cell wall biosynthesis
MRIAHCLPDQRWVEEMRGGNLRDAAHIQQKYISEGLYENGHSITWVAPQGIDHVVVGNTEETNIARQTWTASGWFNYLSKVTWKIQQIFRIPYLNIISNLRRYDACLQIFPGHDVVFERNSLYNSGVAMACKKLNLPYVIFFDADQIAELDFMGEPLAGLLRWRANRLLRYNLKVAHRIVCVSDIAKNHLMKTWNVSSDKLVVLPNAVDVERFKPDPKLGAQARTTLRLTNHPLIIFVGNFYRWHDVASLLDAFAIVLKTHSDAHLILIGDGIERKAMMQRAKDLGLENSVQFTGFVSHVEVSRYVNAADIAVVPVPNMKQEMWLSPMKLFEYMASGKAIVASAIGQIKNVLKDKHNGLLVPAGDENALANAVINLIEDASLKMQLGKQAREDAVRFHSWKEYIPRLEAILIDSIGVAK